MHGANEVVGRRGIDEPPAALPAGIVAQLEAAAVGLQRCARRREPVAEATVDRGLGGPERRDRLAPLARVRELLRHQPAQDPLPAVSRLHSDPRHTGARQLAARDRQVERVRARERDRAPVVEGRDRTVKRKRDPLALPVLLRDALVKAICIADLSSRSSAGCRISIAIRRSSQAARSRARGAVRCRRLRSAP